ncbi:MAG: hypothetical protein NTX25_02430 [Proteobacteria bacterium]|nr:hypothetical protein [Pseudomonadota bacterium]
MLNIRTSLLAVYLLVLIVSACRPKTEIQLVPVKPSELIDSINLVEFKVQRSGTPVEHEVSDINCHTRSDAQKLESEEIESSWYGYQDSDAQTLDIITRFGTSQSFERELVSNSVVRYSITSEKKEAYLCGSGEPAPDSIEFIGLKISHAIHQAHEFYLQSVKAYPELELPELPRIGLGLMPHYQKDIKRREKILNSDGSQIQTATQLVQTSTDNAFYSPFADESLSESIFAISAMPQSVEARDAKLYDGKGLWEFPVVFQHEYGHHVFQSLFGDSTLLSFRHYLKFWQDHPDLHQIIGDHSKSYDFLSLKAQREHQDFRQSSGYLLSSLNEGFADLFAYYSLGQAQNLFKISCFTLTREVASPVMYGGLSKRWDELIWNKIFDSNTQLNAGLNELSQQSPLETCSTPSFNDIHIVGAVIAHSMDAIFNSVISPLSAEQSSLTKASLLFRWVIKLKQSNEILELNNKQTLSVILNTGLGTALTALADSDKSKFCKVVNDYFPLLSARWKDKPYEDTAGILQACP